MHKVCFDVIGGEGSDIGHMGQCGQGTRHDDTGAHSA